MSLWQAKSSKVTQKEEEFVRRFHSNRVSSNRLQAREGPSSFAPRPRKHSKALIVMMTGIASSAIVTSYLVQAHPASSVLSSLLIGFAPLIGLFLLLIIDTLLFVFFVCSAERIFACDDKPAVPKRAKKNKWHIVRGFIPSPLTTLYISLKEHSPPSLRATPATPN